MLQIEKAKESPFPKSIRDTFQNFTQETENQFLSFSSRIVYSATRAGSDQPHTILLFNQHSEVYKSNRDLALTLYLQELFSLCARFGEFNGQNQSTFQESEHVQHQSNYLNPFIIDFKSFAVEGDKIAFVMKETQSIKKLMDRNQGAPKSPFDIEKMIEDVYNHIKFINMRFAISNIEIRPESIYAMTNEVLISENGTERMEYYLTNWMSGARIDLNNQSMVSLSDLQIPKRIVRLQNEIKELRNEYAAPEILNGLALQQDTAEEIYGMGLTSLEMLGIEQEVWKVLRSAKIQKLYDLNLNGIMELVMELMQQQQLTMEERSRFDEVIQIIKISLKQEPLERRKEFITRLLSKVKKRNADKEKKESQQQNEEVQSTRKKNVVILSEETLGTYPEEIKLSDEVVIKEKELKEEVRKLIHRVDPEDMTMISLAERKLSEFDGIAIGNNTTWTNLEELWLHENEIGDKGAVMIGSNTIWKNLKKLSLGNNKIGDKGCEAIGNNTTWTNLEELSLYANEIGDKGAVMIGSNTTWKNLNKLVLHTNKIGDKGCEAIGNNTTWTNLEVLDLSTNEIGDKGAVMIGSNTTWKNLNKLGLGNNKIGDKGCEAIGNNTTWTNLEELWLYANEIGDKGAVMIGSNTTWKHLKKLSLHTNKIGDKGCEAIGNNTTWTNLEELWLYANEIRDKGAVMIGSNTTWKHLKMLSLHTNKIGDKGCEAIGNNTTWTNLEELSLYANEIRDKGAVMIGRNTTWKNLKILVLHTNKIQDQGAFEIACNTAWKHLKLLDLSFNQLTKISKMQLLSNPIFGNFVKLDP